MELTGEACEPLATTMRPSDQQLGDESSVAATTASVRESLPPHPTDAAVPRQLLEQGLDDDGDTAAAAGDPSADTLADDGKSHESPRGESVLAVRSPSATEASRHVAVTELGPRPPSAAEGVPPHSTLAALRVGAPAAQAHKAHPPHREAPGDRASPTVEARSHPAAAVARTAAAERTRVSSFQATFGAGFTQFFALTHDTHRFPECRVEEARARVRGDRPWSSSGALGGLGAQGHSSGGCGASTAPATTPRGSAGAGAAGPSPLVTPRRPMTAGAAPGAGGAARSGVLQLRMAAAATSPRVGTMRLGPSPSSTRSTARASPDGCSPPPAVAAATATAGARFTNGLARLLEPFSQQLTLLDGALASSPHRDTGGKDLGGSIHATAYLLPQLHNHPLSHPATRRLSPPPLPLSNGHSQPPPEVPRPPAPANAATYIRRGADGRLRVAALVNRVASGTAEARAGFLPPERVGYTVAAIVQSERTMSARLCAQKVSIVRKRELAGHGLTTPGQVSGHLNVPVSMGR